MIRKYLASIIGIIFLIGAASFAIKENWIFSILFLIVSIIYFNRILNNKGNKNDNNHN